MASQYPPIKNIRLLCQLEVNLQNYQFVIFIEISKAWHVMENYKLYRKRSKEK